MTRSWYACKEHRNIYQTVQHQEALQAQKFYWYHQRVPRTSDAAPECHQRLKSSEIQQMLRTAMHEPVHLKMFFIVREREREVQLQVPLKAHLEWIPRPYLLCVPWHITNLTPKSHYVEVALLWNHPVYRTSTSSSNESRNGQEALWILFQPSVWYDNHLNLICIGKTIK